MQDPTLEVIDLTSLDYYCPRNKPRIICREVIDLVNESFDDDKNRSTDKNKQASKKKSKDKDGPKKTIEKVKDKSSSKVEKDKDKSSSKAALCSICWDKLGNNPLASTKCGHVYCLMCLEKSLKCNKRCPTCRCILKGASAYHPLYLEIG